MQKFLRNKRIQKYLRNEPLFVCELTLWCNNPYCHHRSKHFLSHMTADGRIETCDTVKFYPGCPHSKVNIPRKCMRIE